MGEQNHYIYEFGPFHLDAQKRLLLREGEIVPLKPKAFDTLLTLVEGCDRVVEKDELMRRVWPGTAVEEGNLTFNISSLRKALGDDPRRHEYIVTIPGEGYRFVAGVRATFDELVVHESTSITVEEEEEISGASSADGELLIANFPKLEVSSERDELVALNPKSEIRNRKWRALAAVALLAAVSGAAFGIYRLVSQRRARDGAASALPFREMDISRLTTSGNIAHAAISPDGKYVAHVTEAAEGDSLWVSNVAAPRAVRIAGPAPTQYVWVAFAPDGDSVYYLTLDRGKGNTALYRAPVLGGPSSMAAYDVGPVGFSPDGQQIAFIRMYGDESRLIVAGSDGSNERMLAARRKPEVFRVTWNAPAWSPDGKTIACQVRLSDGHRHYETVEGVDVVDGSERPLTSARWHHAGQPAWLADGGGLLVTASESETSPEQVWHITVAGGEARRVTHDLDDYHDLSLTRDSSRIAAVQDHSVSSIWVAPEADAGRARQVASESGFIEEAAWTPDGRIIYRSNAGGSAEIWTMNADGSEPKQLTAGALVSRGLAVSPDGRYILFASDRAGHFNIWRVDSDGGNLKQLTDGDGEFYPQCTPDGSWVVYQRAEVNPTIWKVPVGGGGPVQLTLTRASQPAVSPDGGLIAYQYLDPDLDKWGIGVVASVGDGRLVRRFDFPLTVTWRLVRWSPDGKSVAYANSPGGLADIWLQPLDGSRPKRLTDFRAEQILAFNWSRDGRSLAFVRGVETSDVTVIGEATPKGH